MKSLAIRLPTVCMVAFTVGAFGIAGADAADQPGAGQPAQTRTTTTTTEKQQYVQGAQVHIQRLKRDIFRLQQDAGQAGDRSLRIAAANLSVGLKAAETQFANLRHSTGPVWQRMRHELDRSLVVLDRGVRSLDAKLRSSQQ